MSLNILMVEKLKDEADFWRYCVEFEAAAMADGLDQHMFNDQGQDGKPKPTIAYNDAGVLAEAKENDPVPREKTLLQWKQLVGGQMRAMGGFMSIYDKWKIARKNKVGHSLDPLNLWSFMHEIMLHRGQTEQREIRQQIFEVSFDTLDEATKTIDDADKKLRGMMCTPLSSDDKRDALLNMLSNSPIRAGIKTLYLFRT